MTQVSSLSGVSYSEIRVGGCNICMSNIQEATYVINGANRGKLYYMWGAKIFGITFVIEQPHYMLKFQIKETKISKRNFNVISLSWH